MLIMTPPGQAIHSAALPVYCMLSLAGGQCADWYSVSTNQQRSNCVCCGPLISVPITLN